VQQVVGRTLGIGVATGIFLGIGALPASAAPVPPVRPGEVQIGEPLVIERDPPVSTDALSPSSADEDGSGPTRLTAAAVVVGALVLGASGRRRWS
jgi:MYXO-CTERM domain-containing protein